MSEWKETTLGSHLNRVKRKVAVEDGVAYPAVSVTKDGAGLGTKEPFVGGATNYSHLFQVHEGDVVVRTITAFESPAGVAHKVHHGTHVSGVFLTYEVLDSAMPRFLELFFQTPMFWSEMKNRATGTVLRRKTISDGAFCGIPINLPPIAEQRRIVDVIAAVDAQIKALEEEASRMDSVLKVLRLTLLEPRSHWRQTTIGDVAVTATGRAFPNRYQGSPVGKIPYFKVADMNAPGNEREMRNAPNWLTAESIPLVKPRICPVGTVVFPIIGAALLTEKRRVLAQDSAFDQNVMGLVLGDEVTSDFMFAFMSKIRLGDLGQTGAVPSVNQALVSALPIAVPPLEEQREIGDQLQSMHLACESSRAELANLRAFRSTLLTALLNQEVEIPDSYDSVLEVAS